MKGMSRTYIRFVYPEPLWDEWFQADDLSTVLEVQKHVGKVNIERRGEDLVVDKLVWSAS